MAYSGTFSITVSGDPIKESSILGFEAQVQNRALRVDENVVLDERNFKRMTYVMKWTEYRKTWWLCQVYGAQLKE